MCNSPGATRATNTHDITEGIYLQDLVAAKATAIDVRPGQGSLKGSSNTAATRTDLADDIAMQYRGAGDGSVAMPCRDAASLQPANKPSAIRSSLARWPLCSPSATRLGVSHQFMVGRALAAGGANRNVLVNLLES
jgi:hypothetical protein